MPESTLPVSSVLKVAKSSLGNDHILSKSARSDLVKATAIFSLYLQTIALEYSNDSKRSSLSSSDIFHALSEMGLEEFNTILKESLNARKEMNMLKRKKARSEPLEAYEDYEKSSDKDNMVEALDPLLKEKGINLVCYLSDEKYFPDVADAKGHPFKEIF